MFAVGASRDLNRITGDWEVIQVDVDRAVASGLPLGNYRSKPALRSDSISDMLQTLRT